jgi:hypothetical protein
MSDEPVSATNLPKSAITDLAEKVALEFGYDSAPTRKIDIDFIGPSMDCGFRILGFAYERKFVMSADLAY